MRCGDPWGSVTKTFADRAIGGGGQGRRNWREPMEELARDMRPHPQTGLRAGPAQWPDSDLKDNAEASARSRSDAGRLDESLELARHDVERPVPHSILPKYARGTEKSAGQVAAPPRREAAATVHTTLAWSHLDVVEERAASLLPTIPTTRRAHARGHARP